MTYDTLFMGTTHRHNQLGFALNASLLDYIKKGSLTTLQENVSLVHYGRKGRGDFLQLILINDTNKDEILGIINELEFIQPDFCVFHTNHFITNKKGTRFAGIPNLIVEIWSDSNSKLEKEMKYAMYAESGAEHWYIEQDSNKVSCYLGKTQLLEQDISDIIIDQSGYKYDLRYLAL
jgi:hypothetical protein